MALEKSITALSNRPSRFSRSPASNEISAELWGLLGNLRIGAVVETRVGPASSAGLEENSGLFSSGAGFAGGTIAGIAKARSSLRADASWLSGSSGNGSYVGVSVRGVPSTTLTK